MTRRSRRPRPKARKPKYLSLRRHLAPPTPPAPPEEQSASSSCDMPPGAAPVAGAVEGEDGSKRRPPQTEPSPLQPPDHLDRDPHVASLLLLLDDGNRSIAALFGDDGAAESSGSPPSATDSPASSSMNWDGLARRALRGRERWVYCHSSSPPPAASSSGDEEASSAGGGAGRGAADLWWRFAGTAGGSKALALKLDYEEILAAWSDRGPLYIEGDAPQVVPRLHGGCGEPYYAFPVMVEVGPSDAWRVPDIIDAAAAAAAAAAASGGRTTAEAGDERSREERVQRYKEKRRSRLFAKRIRYEVRKQNAQKRPRFKGRFVKQEI